MIVIVKVAARIGMAGGAAHVGALPLVDLTCKQPTHIPYSCKLLLRRYTASPPSALLAHHDTSAKLKKPRPRLDELCQERFPQHSRTLIQSWILQGKVLVDGQPVLKAGVRLSLKSEVKIIAEVPKYVCRAGYKLEAAIEHFKCDVSEKVVLDAGLSTGGFTDCLLQSGAACVYGIDVGYGQVADKIRTDRRVHVLERTNLRHLSSLPQPVDIATLDLSFISILTVMPAVSALMKESSTLITLIKPQFEAQRSQVGSGGIVRDPAVHKEVIDKVVAGVEGHDFRCDGWIESPLKGADGNIEFLACFKRGAPLTSEFKVIRLFRKDMYKSVVMQLAQMRCL
ncbi:hypothetical protein GOP47_0016459 [Adiantum capillus-veneris]|uniref:RNA-binding S4 domain-containing protein n=1 Tax=Adiantum capillus-veneris TaxID=13818 RepID=A0A9D4UII7_ADICA|nr:hypothetical protein GOP47_0016459 [Adiantum capillus-veneris]